MNPLIFRPFRASDAKSVSQLFRLIYADHYVQPQVYLPKLITQNNNDGRWQSMLAVEGARVLGHVALCRDGDAADSPELAMGVVHPATRGQNIATRLSRELLEQSAAAGDACVLIKQVTQHPYSQRMAQTLGFHSTGLLPDYVPSPFAEPMAESIVIGVHLPKGHCRPLPDIAWPGDCRAFMQHLGSVFGVGNTGAVCPSRPLQMTRHQQRVDVVIERLDKRLFDHLTQLPDDWLISLRLALSQHFAVDFQRLTAQGFAFTGVLPAPEQGEWSALFHRGAQTRDLNLHCPHMQQLHDNLQHAVRTQAIRRVNRSAA